MWPKGLVLSPFSRHYGDFRSFAFCWFVFLNMFFHGMHCQQATIWPFVTLFYIYMQYVIPELLQTQSFLSLTFSDVKLADYHYHRRLVITLAVSYSFHKRSIMLSWSWCIIANLYYTYCLSKGFIGQECWMKCSIKAVFNHVKVIQLFLILVYSPRHLTQI